MTMRDYLKEKLNGRKWVVARRSAKLEASGYVVFFSVKGWANVKDAARIAGVVEI